MFSFQPNEVGANVGVSAGQVPHTAAYETPAWYTESLQSFYNPTTSSTGITPLQFDFSGLMNFDTNLTDHNGAFDYTFSTPTTVAPSPTVIPTVGMAVPQAPPTTIETNEQSSTTKKAKKRKTLEDENAHCILPEGSRRKRKPRRLSD